MIRAYLNNGRLLQSPRIGIGSHQLARTRLRRYQRLIAPAMLVFALTGCTRLLHSDSRPEQVYYLRVATSAADPLRSEAAAAAAANAQASAGNTATGLKFGASLRVAHPVAAPGLETSHIVLVQADRRMNFYADSRWPASVPDMVEALAVQSLRASGSWSSVEDSTSPFPSDYLLTLTIRHFEADYTAGTGAPQVRVAFDCLLGKREGREVIASFAAEASAPAAANKLSEVVAAFDTAANAALASLSERALQAVRVQKADTPVPSIKR